MSKTHDILGDLGLVSKVKSLVEQRHRTPEVYNAMKRAEKEHAEHIASIEATIAALGRHVDATGREEIVLVEENGKTYAAHVHRVETQIGVWKTKVDFFTPRKI